MTRTVRYVTLVFVLFWRGVKRLFFNENKFLPLIMWHDRLFSYLRCWAVPKVTQLFPIGGFCFFFQLNSLARILESPTGPIDEKGIQDIKKDLSFPANLVTDESWSSGFNSNLPAKDIPEIQNSNHVKDFFFSTYIRLVTRSLYNEKCLYKMDKWITFQSKLFLW